MGLMGPIGPAGPAGATGPAGPMGPPGLNGLENLHVAFAGYTPTAFTGNLAGRSGAHAKCNAAFPGSHFCVAWELDQANPPPASTSVWIDIGDDQGSSRLFRGTYSTNDSGSCAGWTSASASAKPDGINLGSAPVFTPLGGISTSWVANTDGGCENARPLPCCIGGTSVRFRGFTAAITANLGGRTGATARCSAAFSGSHFCNTWEVDQAAVRAPIPAGGAWIDIGDDNPATRLYRGTYETNDSGSCGGWTIESATAKPDGINLASATILTSLGGISSSWIANTDGGCETARPVACCDGYPPQ